MIFSRETYRSLGLKAATLTASVALTAGLGVSPVSAATSLGAEPAAAVQSRRHLTANDIQRMGMVNGYSEGYEDGISSRRNRSGSNYKVRQSYREAIRGFSNDWGWTDRRVYQNAFRQGYARGFQDGYNSRNRNRNYERSYVFRSYDPFRGYPSYRSGVYSPNGVQVNDSVRQTAAVNGYNDGFGRGAYDRRIGAKKPNPQGHGAYQAATNGYTEDLDGGGVGTYQQFYRRFFEQGYMDGYNGRTQNRNIRAY